MGCGVLAKRRLVEHSGLAQVMSCCPWRIDGVVSVYAVSGAINPRRWVLCSWLCRGGS